MRMFVQPAKREGSAKKLFDRKIETLDVEVTASGDVKLTFIASDIYTAKASQRYSIVCSPREIEMIRDVMEKAAERQA